MSSSRDGSSRTIMSTMSGLAPADDGDPSGDDRRRSLPPASGDDAVE